MSSLQIVGLGGSLNPDSVSVKALRVALLGAQEAGAQTELLELRSLALPLFVPGMAPPQHALDLADAVGRADAMIWASPVYHGGASGSFKNALDWLELLAKRTPPYLTGKVVGLIATAGGVQGLQAINAMEFSVRALRGFTYPLTVPLDRAYQLVDGSGQLSDLTATERLLALGKGVAQTARRLA